MTTAAAIEPGRLRRAVHLDAERLPDGSWRVTGGKGAHIVTADGSACDCTDYGVRQFVCKHRAAVLLRLGDADVLLALREFVPQGGGAMTGPTR